MRAHCAQHYAPRTRVVDGKLRWPRELLQIAVRAHRGTALHAHWRPERDGSPGPAKLRIADNPRSRGSRSYTLRFREANLIHFK